MLRLAQVPEPFVVPAGDQGGKMTGNTSYAGAIDLGDEDLWTFTTCNGDFVHLRLDTTNFTGRLLLYGPSGALLATVQNSTSLNLIYTTTNSGAFTVLVSSFSAGDTGTYGLTANGLSYELRFCTPVIAGANLSIDGIGGISNAVFVIYSTTNVTTPFASWTPALTNNFDQFGVFNYSTGYNPAQQQKYFRFIEQ